MGEGGRGGRAGLFFVRFDQGMELRVMLLKQSLPRLIALVDHSSLLLMCLLIPPALLTPHRRHLDRGFPLNRPPRFPLSRQRLLCRKLRRHRRRRIGPHCCQLFCHGVNLTLEGFFPCGLAAAVRGQRGERFAESAGHFIPVPQRRTTTVDLSLARVLLLFEVSL